MYNVRLGAGVLSTAISVVVGAGAVEVEAAVVAAVVSSAGGACVMTTSIVSFLLSLVFDVCVCV